MFKKVILCNYPINVIEHKSKGRKISHFGEINDLVSYFLVFESFFLLPQILMHRSSGMTKRIFFVGAPLNHLIFMNDTFLESCRLEDYNNVLNIAFDFPNSFCAFFRGS